MVPDILIPEPIAFNCFKHHRQFIIAVLRNESYEVLKERLTTLNNNYIDIYTGDLLPSMICAEINHCLTEQCIRQRPEFEKWIASKGGFSVVQLSDQSLWILRLSDDPNRFVHIHPSKTGIFSERLKGSTLKTYFLLIKQKGGIFQNPTTKELNLIRKEAGLSPIKRWEPGQGFRKFMKLFR